MELNQQLKAFIQSQLLAEHGPRPLADDEDLLISGLVDSLGVVRLITYIEQALDVSIPPEDVTLENFQTVAHIAAYLQQNHARQP